jgi:hypothetical protein
MPSLKLVAVIIIISITIVIVEIGLHSLTRPARKADNNDYKSGIQTITIAIESYCSSEARKCRSI